MHNVTCKYMYNTFDCGKEHSTIFLNRNSCQKILIPKRSNPASFFFYMGIFKQFFFFFYLNIYKVWIFGQHFVHWMVIWRWACYNPFFFFWIQLKKNIIIRYLFHAKSWGQISLKFMYTDVFIHKERGEGIDNKRLINLDST